MPLTAGSAMVVVVDPALPLRRPPRRVAMLSVHTSPLDQPGTGDAGGMNVYIAEVATRLAARGTEVEVFTRATAGVYFYVLAADGQRFEKRMLVLP